MARRSIEKNERCPHCGGRRVFTTDSRYAFANKTRRRRYECEECRGRFSTYEISASDYERLRAIKVNPVEIDTVIAALRAIKVQFGDTNGHR